MTRSEIDLWVNDVHRMVWVNRDAIWDQPQPYTPIRLLSPRFAAKVLGVEFVEEEHLGRFGHMGHHFEVAGSIDRVKSRIAVSRRFPNNVMRFTAAHELGHWVMHPNEYAHRDRPIAGLSAANFVRPPIEREADQFAASYLMPANLLEQKFEDQFGACPLQIDERMAYCLSPSDIGLLLSPIVGRLDRETALASAEFFSGRRFNSLANQFGVSVASMAIRLRELGLVVPRS